MKKEKFYLLSLLIIVLGILSYFYFIERCKRDKVVCPSGMVTFSHRCPEQLFKEYIKDTELKLNIDLNSIDNFIDMELKDVLLKEERKQLSEKYNQYTTRLNHILKSAFYDLNSDPCNATKANYLAKIREKIIENSTQIEELLIQNKSSIKYGASHFGPDDFSAFNLGLDKMKDNLSDNNYQNSDFQEGKSTVAFYGYDTQPSDFQSIDKYLKSNFNLIASKNLLAKPSWLANQSTVFYYSDFSKNNAIEVARNLQKITKKKFVLVQTTELDIPGNSKDHSLRIHFIN